MNTSLTLFLFLVLSAISSLHSSSCSEDLLQLPRPLIPDRRIASAGDLDPENLRLFCQSWRFAGEANNLAPWATVPSECGGYVREYMTGKAYRSDLDITAHEAAVFARSVPISGDGKDSWVFDVDETLLSNLPYYADHGFGLEIFKGEEFDKWVERAAAPALPSSLSLYRDLLNLGFKIFLLTGRSEAQRAATVHNLNTAGYQGWEKLILRETEDEMKTAKVYKSEKRSELVGEGFRIQGNSGDQWSDLLGSFDGNRSFKLPNPMYYIP